MRSFGFVMVKYALFVFNKKKNKHDSYNNTLVYTSKYTDRQCWSWHKNVCSDTLRIGLKYKAKQKNIQKERNNLTKQICLIVDDECLIIILYYTITGFCRSEYEFLLTCKIILTEAEGILWVTDWSINCHLARSAVNYFVILYFDSKNKPNFLQK